MLGNFVFSNPTNYILERIRLSISMRNCQNMEKMYSWYMGEAPSGKMGFTTRWLPS